jgi:radical SAM superfamily enzyme
LIIVEMDGQQTRGGCIVCDMAEECDFNRDLILKTCEYAEQMEDKR